MERRSKSRAQAGRGKNRSWFAVLVLCFGIVFPGMLVAQDNSAPPAKPPISATHSSPNHTTITQQPQFAPEAPLYTFPENECSADFWNPYGKQALTTQSGNRVQQSPLELLDPADTIEQLPSEVVDQAKPVRQLRSEVVHPANRVQQMDSEVVHPAPPIGERSGERLAPAQVPDLDWPVFPN